MKRVNMMLFGGKLVLLTGRLGIDSTGRMTLSPFMDPVAIEEPATQTTLISGNASIYHKDMTIQSFDGGKVMMVPMKNIGASLYSLNQEFIQSFAEAIASGEKADLVSIGKGHLAFSADGELCIDVRFATFIHGTLGKRISAR